MAEQIMQETAGKVIPAGYKQTEVGVIPEDWDVVPFFDSISIASGQVSPLLEPYASMTLVAPDHIESNTGRLLAKQSAKEQNAISGKYYFCSGDTIYSKIRPYLKKAIYAEFNGLCSADMYPLRAKEHLEPKLILPLILSERFSAYAESVSVRSGMPKINRVELADFSFALPRCLKEQTAIANVLSDSDALIGALEQLIGKKQAIKTATMQQLLTGRTRLPAFALRPDGTPKGYKPSELGDIPEDWEVMTYGEIFTFLSTSTNSRADLSNIGEYGYIHYGDIHTKFNNALDLNEFNLPRISSHLASSSFVENGDVVMADASEDYEGIGKSVEICNVGSKKVVAGLHTFLLRDKNKYMADGYRGYLHCIPAVKNAFDRLATGMKVYGLSKNNLAVVPVPVPSQKEQTAIGGCSIFCVRGS